MKACRACAFTFSIKTLWRVKHQNFEFTVLFESFRNEGFLLNPKEKCYIYDSDKYAKFNGLQILVTLFFFSKTLKLQLGVYICDHTNRLKLTTNKQCKFNHKFLVPCVLKTPIGRYVCSLSVNMLTKSWSILVNISQQVDHVSQHVS